MTTLSFLEKVFALLDDDDYKITFSLAKKKNFMLYCNRNFIGGLFDEELCLTYSDACNILLQNPEPVYMGYSNDAVHKMLSIPLEVAKEALRLTYKETCMGGTLLFQIDLTGFGTANIEESYEVDAVFLKFSYENGLLLKNPLDKFDRIIRMTFLMRDLTTKGKMIFPKLRRQLNIYRDRGGRGDTRKMLNKWIAKLV